MRKSDGIRLHVRGQDSSRSTNRDGHGTPVPTDSRNVGNDFTSDDVDRLCHWAQDALLGSVDVRPAILRCSARWASQQPDLGGEEVAQLLYVAEAAARGEVVS